MEYIVASRKWGEKYSCTNAVFFYKVCGEKRCDRPQSAKANNGYASQINRNLKRNELARNVTVQLTQFKKFV